MCRRHSCPKPTFDQSGDVGHRRAFEFSKIDDADHGVQRGKGIGRDLWVGGGNLAQQSRFPGIGIPDQTRVRNAAEFQHEVAFLPVVPRRKLPRHPVSGTLEMNVPPAAVASLAQHHFGALAIEIRDQFEFSGIDAGGRLFTHFRSVFLRLFQFPRL